MCRGRFRGKWRCGDVEADVERSVECLIEEICEAAQLKSLRDGLVDAFELPPVTPACHILTSTQDSSILQDY